MKRDAIIGPALTSGAVTAVLVCWNHALFVRQAVESALSQSRPIAQIIVFDNGSVDGSIEVLLELKREYGFTLILQENIGLVPTLNRGLALATGEFFTLVSTDDAWLPGKTALQAGFLELHEDVHMVSAQVRAVDANNQPVESFNLQRPGQATFSDLMTRGNVVYGPTVMCRTATLREVGGYDARLIIEDYSQALQFTSLGLCVYVLPDVVTNYRRHGGNLTNRSLSKELGEIGSLYRSRAEYRGFVAYHFPRRFRTLVEADERWQALRWLLMEPIEWTWSNLGVGLVKMILPWDAINRVRGRRGVGS